MNDSKHPVDGAGDGSGGGLQGGGQEGRGSQDGGHDGDSRLSGAQQGGAQLGSEKQGSGLGGSGLGGSGQEDGVRHGGARPSPWVAVLGVLVAAALGIGIVNGFAGLTPSLTGKGGPTPIVGEPVASPPVTDPAQVLPERDPVDVDGSVEVVSGVPVTLGAFEAVDGGAVLPGEVAGPAIRFEVIIRNTTSATIDLSSTVVNVYFTDARTPASPLTEPGAVRFPAELAAGDTATAVFVYTVPVDQRELITVTVDYLAGVPAVVFQGPGPR